MATRIPGPRRRKPAMRQAPVSSRRSPRQERARVSVEAILTATIQILTTDGRAGLNTNRIAEQAGVSIGTLYQYFADKEAIAVAVARRMLTEGRASMMAALADALADPAAELDRVAVRETIRIYRNRTKARRTVMETMFGLGKGKEVNATANEVGQLLAQRMDPGTFESEEWKIRLFLVTRGVEAVIRAAAYEAPPFFDTPQFEGAVVAMVRGLLPELVALQRARQN